MSVIKGLNPVWRLKWIHKQFAELLRLPNRKKEENEAQEILEMLININNLRGNDLQNIRNIKLLQILQYANKNCTYYKHLFKQNSFNPSSLNGFERIPLLDKEIIRIKRPELISNKIGSMDYYNMNTGGSTGEPLEFLVSNFAGKIDAIHQEFVFKTTMNYIPGDIIVAFDGSSVPLELLEVNKFWVETSSKDLPYGRLSYSSLYLKDDTISYYVKHILENKPKIFRGYPSFINDVAEYILRKNITIPYQIKGVQLTAENVHDWQIENIRKAFDTDVFMQYGHSEVSIFGYTYDNTHEYFCSPFYGYTEVLGEECQHVKPGEVGEVVVTGFNNFAMPFIRYKTGDLALFNGDENGIVKLGKIIGRTQDFIYDKNREKVALTALIFGQHFGAFKNIRKWQLQQDIPGAIKVRITKEDRFCVEDEIEIRSKFKDICGIDTEFEYVTIVPLTARGKFRFLIQNVIA